MFKDYYEILDVPFGATDSEIKSAYKHQAIRWHPDRNPGIDVTNIMQYINEAYAILKDPIKKSRYDKEYLSFKKYKEKIYSQTSDNQKTKGSSFSSSNRHQYNYDYTVHDETLNEDIQSAREYAKDLVNEFFEKLKKNSKIAAKGAWEGAQGYVWAFLVLFIIGLMIRACAG